MFSIHFRLSLAPNSNLESRISNLNLMLVHEMKAEILRRNELSARPPDHSLSGGEQELSEKLARRTRRSVSLLLALRNAPLLHILWLVVRVPITQDLDMKAAFKLRMT